MWSMQMSIVGGAVMAAAGITMPASAAATLFNPLVNNYKTSDGRWLALCMLQRDLYWKRLCEVIDRKDLLDDPRFADPESLTANTAEAAAELETTFLTRSLAEWRAVLATQDGQWDVVTTPLEVPSDPQAVANGYVQPISYEGGMTLPLIAAPAQIDRTPPELGQAPEFNAHAEEVLGALGLTDEQILEAKISGAVV
jgi:crotonobetainyl-CoA:carnitine CoA-transferase CaiB-like acyl-CoA transferase